MFTDVSTGTCPVSGVSAGRAQPLRLLLAEAPRRRVRRRVVKPDLDRRRREALSREFASRVTEHARWLPQADLALLSWVYRSQRPLTELAATGVAPRWVLHRRLNRIVARVLSPTYRHVAMLLAVRNAPTNWSPGWPPRQDQAALDAESLQVLIGRAIFVSGVPVREVARVLGLSRQQVTRQRDIIALQAEAMAQATAMAGTKSRAG